jgi:hypothetical protein
MPLKHNVDDLRKEFIGKTVNWLTVVDVFRDSNNIIVCECRCRCGSTTITPIKAIRSSRAKSCGCFHKSKEFSDKLRQWYRDNPEKVKQRSSKYREWCANNSDRLEELGKRYSEWVSNHPEISDANRRRMISMNRTSNKERSTLNRTAAIESILESSDTSDKIHPDDLQKLLSGAVTSGNKIRTRCPLCDVFSEHNVRDIFNISKKELKCFRLCSNCMKNFSSSSYELEIADYISTFYSGELLVNSRDIISPFELDLYYPEKRIAIEFNGDYWHSNCFKSRDYHYNKFKSCFESGITLVSIFESNWNSRREDILSYLHDLFHGISNSLSIVNDDLMNNNYPAPHMKIDLSNYIEDYYIFRGKRVYTAGLASIKLDTI